MEEWRTACIARQGLYFPLTWNMEERETTWGAFFGYGILFLFSGGGGGVRVLGLVRRQDLTFFHLNSALPFLSHEGTSWQERFSLRLLVKEWLFPYLLWDWRRCPASSEWPLSLILDHPHLLSPSKVVPTQPITRIWPSLPLTRSKDGWGNRISRSLTFSFFRHWIKISH